VVDGAALACAKSLMHLTRTVHPPAGSNPIIVMLSVPDWSFLMTPTLCGSPMLEAVALVFNNWERDSRYPRYW
jgi:CBS-domain-containing membrane protein